MVCIPPFGDMETLYKHRFEYWTYILIHLFTEKTKLSLVNIETKLFMHIYSMGLQLKNQTVKAR